MFQDHPSFEYLKLNWLGSDLRVELDCTSASAELNLSDLAAVSLNL